MIQKAVGSLFHLVSAIIELQLLKDVSVFHMITKSELAYITTRNRYHLKSLNVASSDTIVHMGFCSCYKLHRSCKNLSTSDWACTKILAGWVTKGMPGWFVHALLFTMFVTLQHSHSHVQSVQRHSQGFARCATVPVDFQFSNAAVRSFGTNHPKAPIFERDSPYGDMRSGDCQWRCATVLLWDLLELSSKGSISSASCSAPWRSSTFWTYAVSTISGTTISQSCCSSFLELFSLHFLRICNVYPGSVLPPWRGSHSVAWVAWSWALDTGHQQCHHGQLNVVFTPMSLPIQCFPKMCFPPQHCIFVWPSRWFKTSATLSIIVAATDNSWAIPMRTISSTDWRLQLKSTQHDVIQ